ncbi:hypothetical protein AVEN_222074-1 [Araneus ventricosus]|uniref:Uncharacterized protein n=1 Tax=Araneus ventricosus TaxID=182803 RepID=A0A4Y2X8Y8_ARAVE|nr:hypothetical protein AVEN_222074-1 [Araneus ventricosus]
MIFSLSYLGWPSSNIKLPPFPWLIYGDGIQDNVIIGSLKINLSAVKQTFSGNNWGRLPYSVSVCVLACHYMSMGRTIRCKPSPCGIPQSSFRRFNKNFGVAGILDWLHGTDKHFRKSEAHKRDMVLFSLTPLSVQDNHK